MGLRLTALAWSGLPLGRDIDLRSTAMAWSEIVRTISGRPLKLSEYAVRLSVQPHQQKQNIVRRVASMHT